MGRRLPPPLLAPRKLLLLLLLGAATAAGPDFSGLEDSLPQEQSTAMAPTSPFPGSAERPGNPWQAHWLGFATPVLLTQLHPRLAPSPAGDGLRGAPTGGLPSHAPGTPLAPHGAGRGASVPGARGRPRLAPALLTSTTFVTLLPLLALLPGSASPKAVAGPAPSPSLLPDGIPSSGAGGRAGEAWQPTSPILPLGLIAQEVMQTNGTERGLSNRPLGSEAPPGTTAAEKETSCTAAAEDLEMPSTEPPCPNGAGHCRTPQEAKSPMADILGAGRPSAWPPDMERAELSPTTLPSPSAAVGQDWDGAPITTPLAQLLPHIQTRGPLGLGANVLSEQLGGGVVHAASAGAPGRYPATAPPKTGTAVGPFRPVPGLPPPPVPSQSSAGVRHAVETIEEETLPGTSARNKAALLPGTEAEGQCRHPPPGDSVASSAAVRATEAPPSPSFSSPHLGTTLLLSSMGSTPPLASLRGNDPKSSGPPLLALPWTSSTGGATAPPGAGQRSSVDSASFQGSATMDTVLIPTVALWEGPSTATREGRGSQGTAEPYSTWSGKGADPTQSFHGLAQFWPEWPTKEGTLSGPMEAFTDRGETVGSRKGPHRATASLAMQTSPGQAGEGAFVGRGTEVGGPPSSRTLGRPASAGWTASPTSSKVAWLTTKGGVRSPAPSRAPELLHFSVVVPTSGTRGAELHPPPTSAARTGSWEWEERPSLPTESSTGQATHSPQGPGPVSTAAASVAPAGGSWQTGAPVSAPGEGSAPPIAGTWLLTAALEEEEEAPAATALAPAVLRDGEGRARSRHAFVVENQPPLLKDAFLRVPCELVLAMEFSRSFQNPASPEYQGLVLSINETVTPFFASVPGFQRLEVKAVRPGSVVVALHALFLAGAPGLWAALNRSSLSERLPPGLWVANARVLQSVTPERHLDLCALLFSCHAGYECVAGENGSASCISMCHRDYCKNQGICTHAANHTPICQCPVGSDFWFLGVRCDYKVTQQGLLGVACGLLLSLVVVGVAIAGMVIRRVRLLLLEARVDQTKSSYRRFCRLDDISARYWSEPWLASASSLDNPAFSNSEELLHLQILDTSCYSCQEDCLAPDGYCRQLQGTCVRAAGRPSSQYNWAESSNSVNDPMIDSGKASEVFSISSWPLEPIQWSPFPAPHKLSREQLHKTQRPHSYCEGMEQVSLERSWTA